MHIESLLWFHLWFILHQPLHPATHIPSTQSIRAGSSQIISFLCCRFSADTQNLLENRSTSALCILGPKGQPLLNVFGIPLSLHPPSWKTLYYLRKAKVADCLCKDSRRVNMNSNNNMLQLVRLCHKLDWGHFGSSCGVYISYSELCSLAICKESWRLLKEI